jgi:hypothetical protein
MRLARATGLIIGLMMFAPAAGAQTTVTQADVQRLQDSLTDASTDIERLRSRDAALASQLQSELDDLKEEVSYLRVTLRKGRAVPRSEYTDVRDRIENVRTRARGEGGRTGSGSPAEPGTTAAESRRSTGTERSVIPVGTEIDVRLHDSLNSGRNHVEDRFLAISVVDLQVDGRVVIPAGSELRGIVTAVDSAGRMDRKGRITVAFDQMTIDGRVYPMRGTVTQALESEGVKGEVAKIGTGAGVGAIIGGILGGFKGAVAGILIGGGGVVAATPGKDVDLPSGIILRVRLDQPPAVR